MFPHPLNSLPVPCDFPVKHQIFVWLGPPLDWILLVDIDDVCLVVYYIAVTYTINSC